MASPYSPEHNPLTANLKEIVLIGGGHTHALVLNALAMKPIQNARITLISNVSMTPYSGMLSGFIEGIYHKRELFIDLVKLCHRTQTRLIIAPVEGIDPLRRLIHLKDRPDIPYDFASLNIGSQTNLPCPMGDGCVPVKPIHKFLPVLDMIDQNGRSKTLKIAVIGGGISAVETAIGLRKRMGAAHQITIVSRSKVLCEGLSKGAASRIKNRVEGHDIELVVQYNVDRASNGALRSRGKDPINFDFAIFATQPSPQSGFICPALAKDEQGFILVERDLRVIGFDDLFAVGDCATLKHSPRPKSGVYAVRQAQPLLENLHRACAGKALKPYNPQKSAMALISTGDKTAVLSKGALAFGAPLVWDAKNRIDQKFMQKFSEGKAMVPSKSDPRALELQQRCSGCAAKLGPKTLTSSMKVIRSRYESDGFNPLKFMNFHDDCSTVPQDSGHHLHTIDHMPSPFLDEYMFGRIATIHSLSDIYAMGGAPQYAQVTLVTSLGPDYQTSLKVQQTMLGVLDVLKEHGSYLTAGHSAEGYRDSLSISVSGQGGKGGFSKKVAKAGHHLILTKPLGTGVIMAGLMSGKTSGYQFEAALKSMNQSNKRSCEIGHRYASSATDITGFGLVGHLREMLLGTSFSASLDPSRIPLLPGARKVSEAGVRSTLFPQTKASFPGSIFYNNWQNDPSHDILFDPQTSGGLLLAVPPDQSQQMCEELWKEGYEQAAIIGKVDVKSEAQTLSLQPLNFSD